MGCARLTLVAALFLLVDELVGSPRAAGVAVLVYAANPNFLYWDAQYAYESIALPLAILAVFFLARRKGQRPSRLAIVSSSAAALAVVPTHHITALALAAVLLGWAAAAWLSRRRARGMTTYLPVVPATVIASATAVWLAAVAPITVSYLGPVLSRAVTQGIQLIVDHQTSRTLFANTGQAVTAPGWEDAAAIGGTLVIL